MKIYLKEEIQKPVDEVFKLFTNRELMKSWQPGLLGIEPLGIKNGNPQYRLLFRIGNRNMVITETILKSAFPDHQVLYSLKGIDNRSSNKFEAIGPNKTLWKSTVEFKFKWLMKLIGIFMRNGLEQQTKIIMRNFRQYAERHSTT